MSLFGVLGEVGRRLRSPAFFTADSSREIGHYSSVFTNLIGGGLALA